MTKIRNTWVSVLIDRNITVYFDSFGIEYIPQEVLDKIRYKSITHNIFRTQKNRKNAFGKNFIRLY